MLLCLTVSEISNQAISALDDMRKTDTKSSYHSILHHQIRVNERNSKLKTTDFVMMMRQPLKVGRTKKVFKMVN